MNKLVCIGVVLFLMICVNAETGTVIVEKQTDPDGVLQDFSFTGDISGTIKDGEQIVYTGLNPGTYTSQEIVPMGWELESITCDDDNSSGNWPAKTATFQLEAGETVKCVFVNKRILPDLGDAPDSTNHAGTGMTAYPGVSANYPTVYDPATGLPEGPRHADPWKDAWLGRWFTGEQDADQMPDEDGITNIDPSSGQADLDGSDDLMNLSIPMTHGIPSYFTYTVTVSPAAASRDRYVNVWFDWNRDGDWADTLTVASPNDAPEWAVQNQLLSGLGPGTYVFMTPVYLPWNPSTVSDKDIWMRISIAEQPAPSPGDGRGPANGYEYGETEDYLLEAGGPGPVPAPEYPILAFLAVFAAAAIATLVIKR